MGPLRVCRKNEIDDTLRVKACLPPKANSIKNLFLLNHQHIQEHTFTRTGVVFFVQFSKCMHTNKGTLFYTNTDTLWCTHLHLRSLPHTSLGHFEILPWVLANNRWQNGTRLFRWVSSFVEGTHLSSALYWFKSIRANLINSTVLVLQMSVFQRTVRHAWLATALCSTSIPQRRLV